MRRSADVYEAPSLGRLRALIRYQQMQQSFSSVTSVPTSPTQHCCS